MPADTVLNAFAIFAAFGIAILEWRRAKRAETDQLRAPSNAALALVERTILLLQNVINSATETEAEKNLVEVKRWTERGEVALKRIATIPVPNADLILALNDSAAGMENVLTIIGKLPEGDRSVRQGACEHRIHELEVYRKILVHFASMR